MKQENKTNIEKEFYAEVDKTHKYSYWRILIIAFWILIFSVILGCFYAYNLVKIEKAKTAAKISSEEAEQVSNVISLVNENPTLMNDITLQENELSSYLFIESNKGERKFKNIQAKIYSDKITLSGLLISPIETTVDLDIFPVITDGRVSFEVKNASFGYLNIKEPFIKLFGKKYIARLNEILNQQNNMYISSIILNEGSLEITGQAFKNYTND
ncbi:MAG: hypothetical protein WCW17_00875 [Patescibacteria group bacterium]|jgi:hypothetical protein